MLSGLLARRPPTKISIQERDTKFSFEFDSGTNLQELAVFVERLRATVGTT
jgi:hypothetical protein